VDYGNTASSSIVAYGMRDLDELQLAYAASVHKSQGSEYPCIVLLLLPQHGPMLRRDVLYTAVTRAKRLCVIVGSTDALARAVRTSDPEARNTRLKERLRESGKVE
jgi:exodeoxyribonuclease V alpha subunit